MKRKYLNAGMAGVLLLSLIGTAGCGTEDENVFTPRLDTEASLELNTVGFFGNFEALDQVTADFNEYYPNVTFSYEQTGIDNIEEYIDSNKELDILMTSAECFDRLGDKFVNYCADLSQEEINLSDIDGEMLKAGYHDGKLSTIPMGQNIYGVVVNKTLLEKEGLSVPQTYDEFINALTVLKEKGYTPIQAPNSKVYAELTESMVYDMLLDDKSLYESVTAGDRDKADDLLTVFDKIDDIMAGGFTDETVNANYPEDNYDGAILSFFEGDVPFWVCNTEKVSGMKKRESKSEAFTANPFEYTFIDVPLGDKGAYVYREPWFGFAVNKDSDAYDYAVEFIRFLATRDEINTMADIKGIPSVAKETNDVETYREVLAPEKKQMECVNEGQISTDIVSGWYSCVNKYVAGDFASKEEALDYFVDLCSGQAE